MLLAGVGKLKRLEIKLTGLTEFCSLFHSKGWRSFRWPRRQIEPCSFVVFSNRYMWRFKLAFAYYDQWRRETGLGGL